MRPIIIAFTLLAATAVAQDHIVVSYNIRYDNRDDGADRWDLRKEALVEAVLAEQPSLIGIQEALAQQVAFLDERWKAYARFGVGREDGIAKGEFTPIYFDSARYSLIAGRTVWLSETPSLPSKGWDAACERIATIIELNERSTGEKLLVVSSHWDHVGERARKESAAMLLREIESALSARNAVIMMGDLNAEPDSEPINLLARFLTDACPVNLQQEPTFNGFEPDDKATKRIDYIWHAPHRWISDDYRVIKPKVNQRQASDHHMLVARLRLLPK